MEPGWWKMACLFHYSEPAEDWQLRRWISRSRKNSCCFSFWSSLALDYHPPPFCWLKYSLSNFSFGLLPSWSFDLRIVLVTLVRTWSARWCWSTGWVEADPSCPSRAVAAASRVAPIAESGSSQKDLHPSLKAVRAIESGWADTTRTAIIRAIVVDRATHSDPFNCWWMTHPSSSGSWDSSRETGFRWLR